MSPAGCDEPLTLTPSRLGVTSTEPGESAPPLAGLFRSDDNNLEPCRGQKEPRQNAVRGVTLLANQWQIGGILMAPRGRRRLHSGAL